MNNSTTPISEEVEAITNSTTETSLPTTPAPTIGDVFVDDFLLEEVSKESSINELKTAIFDSAIKHTNTFTPNVKVLNEILEYVKKNGQEDASPELQSEVFKQLSDLCIFNRRVSEEHLFDNIKSIKQLPRSSVYGVLMKFYEERGCIKEALEIFENVEDNNNENIIHTGITLYARMKDIEKVEALFSRLQNPNGRHWSSLVYAYVNVGMMEKAHEITVKLQGSKHLTADIFAPILNHHVKNNNIDLALRFFHEMPDMGIKRMTSTYTILISAACNQDRNDLISFLFSHMRKDKVKPSVSIYSFLFYYYFNKNQLDKVYHYYVELLKDGYEIPINSYRILLIALADSKKLNELKELERIIIDKTGGSNSAYQIIYAYTITGNLNEAERVFFRFRDKIQDESLRERLYNTMLATYLRFNQDWKAFSLLESFPFSPTSRTVEVLYREGAKDIPSDVFAAQYKFTAKKSSSTNYTHRHQHNNME